MSQTEIDALVGAALPLLGLPTDAASRRGVGMHAGRLAAMAALVMAVPLDDEVETASTFEP